MAVTLVDGRGAVDSRDARIGDQLRIIGAKPHRAAEIAARRAGFELALVHPLGHHADDRLIAGAELGGRCAFDAGEIARGLDAGHLHAEADAEIRHLAFTGEAGRLDLAFRAAIAEAAGHENAVDVLKIGRGILALEDLRIDPVEIDFHPVGDAAMHERFHQRFIGVLEAGIFADDGDGHLTLRIAERVDDVVPARQVWRSLLLEAEDSQHLGIEPFGMIGERDGVDLVDVLRLDHGGFAHVAEERELAALAFRDRPVRAAEQDIRLDSDGAQFLHGMLRRLGLELARARDIRQQGQMHEQRMAFRQVVLQLADRLEERQALDVTDRTADLDQREIIALVAREHEVLDGVGDVRNHLHGRAEVIAATLFRDDFLIDAAGGDIVLLDRRAAGEALVMT